MLQDARTRHDILSQAYQALQAEYLKLKAESSSPSPASLGLDSVHHQHQHHQQQLSSSSMAAPYGSIPGSAADLSGAFVSAASMAVLHAGSDLDAYLYPNVGSYGL